MPYCRKCKTEKAEVHFEPDSRTQTGFATICIECRGYSGETKVCPKCQNTVRVEHFAKSGNICRECRNVYNRKAYALHPDRQKAYHKKYREKNKEKVRETLYRIQKFVYHDEHSKSAGYLTRYEHTPKRRLYKLKQYLQLAKKEKTKEKLKKQIEELELLINQKQHQ